MNTVSVREHARLTTGPVPGGSLDVASVPVSAFDWLCQEAQRYRTTGAPLVRIEGRHWLRLDNYVGVLETPCGTRIEILPKHVHGESDVASARRVLIRMLRVALHLPVRYSGPTALQTFDAPVSEWIIQQFLHELDALVRRGLRFDYQPVEEETRFLRGRLQLARQLRQPAGRQHLFQIEHQLVELPRSRDIAGDFRRWSSDRLMSHYAAIRSWCELILSDRNPMSAMGHWTGRSLLFPMEKVFEAYVEASLRRSLPPGARLRTQAASHYLCRQGDRRLFQLRPDFLIEHEDSVWVVDAKWKLLDVADVQNHYGLSQGDFYQLFAYGCRYRRGHGRLALVFPKTQRFPEPLETFNLDDGLLLDALPLDLESGKLTSAGFGPGAWRVATLASTEEAGA